MVMNAIVVVTKYSLGHSALFGDIVTSLLEMKINHQLHDQSLLTYFINMFIQIEKILTAGY